MTTIKISEAESVLLQLLWSHSPLTAAELAEQVPSDRNWQLATVKTLLARLVAKRAIRAEAGGRRFIYHPVVEREALAV